MQFGYFASVAKDLNSGLPRTNFQQAAGAGLELGVSKLPVY